MFAGLVLLLMKTVVIGTVTVMETAMNVKGTVIAVWIAADGQIDKGKFDKFDDLCVFGFGRNKEEKGNNRRWERE